MESQIINTFFFGIIAGLSTISGMYLVLYKKRWAEKNSIFLLSFSAGALLAAAFFHIIPESIELFKNALLTILIGFIFFYLLESIITGHHCHDEQCRLENLSTLALISLGFHSLIDGLIIGIGFEVSLKIGLVGNFGSYSSRVSRRHYCNVNNDSLPNKKNKSYGLFVFSCPCYSNRSNRLLIPG